MRSPTSAAPVRDAPLMLLVTARDEPPDVEAGFAAFLGRLASLPSVTMLRLAGLDVAAAASLIDMVGGDLDPEQGVNLTGGNPRSWGKLHAKVREAGRSARWWRTASTGSVPTTWTSSTSPPPPVIR